MKKIIIALIGIIIVTTTFSAVQETSDKVIMSISLPKNIPVADTSGEII